MPNTGVKLDADKVAKRIREIEKNDINLQGKQITGVADPAIFADQGSGSTVASLMAKNGVYYNKGDNARLSGKMQYHSRLAFDEDGLPMYYVFKSCKDYIRTMPNLVYSMVDVEDIDTTGEDHIYDERKVKLPCERKYHKNKSYHRSCCYIFSHKGLSFELSQTIIILAYMLQNKRTTLPWSGIGLV